MHASFVDCKIVGADFFKCGKKFFSVCFKDCTLLYCNFTDLRMKQTSFQGCKLSECHFVEISLAAADFTEADLSGTIFHHADLSKANFCEAKNYCIDVRTNKVTKAKFSFPEALTLLHAFDIEIVQ